MPKDITYSIEDLKKFISKDGEPSIAFYGGEPLLRVEKIKEIMDKIKAKHYILQTNGLLLDKLDEEYIRKFSTILVSIDGRKETTEFYRGKVYDRVIRNVKKINGYFDGEIIARMVATQRTEIYKDVTHLLSLGIFTHIHWQIDAVWSNDGIWQDFRSWTVNYNKGILKLVDYWVKSIKAGRVLGIVPFLGVFTAILRSYNHPPCASGFKSFAITTDGKVLACPICPELDWNLLGTIYDSKLKKVKILDPCPSCEYFSVCGGRCLFFNRERLWGEEGFNLVCSTVKNLVNSIKSRFNEILKVVEMGVVDLNSLIYPKFLNTTEIIP